MKGEGNFIDFVILKVWWSEYDDGSADLQVNIHHLPDEFNDYILCDVVCWELGFAFDVKQNEEEILARELTDKMKDSLSSKVFVPFVEFVISKFKPQRAVILPLRLIRLSDVFDFEGNIPDADKGMIIQQDVIYDPRHVFVEGVFVYKVNFLLRPGYIYRVRSTDGEVVEKFLSLRRAVRNFVGARITSLKEEPFPNFNDFKKKYRFVYLHACHYEDTFHGYMYLSWVSPVMVDTHVGYPDQYTYKFHVKPGLWENAIKPQLLKLKGDFSKLCRFLLSIVMVVDLESVTSGGVSVSPERNLPILVRFLSRFS